MPENFLKIFYFFFSGIAFGFGIAMVLLKNIAFSGFWYWAMASLFLAVGGFLLALGFVSKKSDNGTGSISQEKE